MRILFTVTNDLSFDQRMQRICRTLALAGHQVTLVGFEKSWSVALRDEPYAQKRLRLLFRKGKLFYLEYNLRLFFLLLFRRFDAVCAIDLDTLAPAYLVSSIRKRPLVFDAHEYFTELPEVVGRGFVGPFWRSLESWLLPRVRHCFTVSETIARAYEAKYGQPFRVLPNYPVLREDHRPLPAPKEFILYQGTINRGRGLEALIESSALTGTQVHIAGEGDLSEEMRDYADSCGASEVRFLGYLQPESLRETTAAAWLGYNLLEDRGLSYYYSLSNKFFDYLHAGVPQLAPDFPEYRRINRRWEVAVLLKEPDVRSIAEAISALRSDPQRMARMRQNCLEARKHLCWQNLEADVLDFYDTMSESH